MILFQLMLLFVLVDIDSDDGWGLSRTFDE